MVGLRRRSQGEREEGKMSTPYIGYGNDTLGKQPRVADGDRFICPDCNEQHALEAARDANGQKTDLLLFYRCQGKSKLGGVSGQLIVGVKCDVSGEL